MAAPVTSTFGVPGVRGGEQAQAAMASPPASSQTARRTRWWLRLSSITGGRLADICLATLIEPLAGRPDSTRLSRLTVRRWVVGVLPRR